MGHLYAIEGGLADSADHEHEEHQDKDIGHPGYEGNIRQEEQAAQDRQRSYNKVGKLRPEHRAIKSILACFAGDFVAGFFIARFDGDAEGFEVGRKVTNPILPHQFEEFRVAAGKRDVK